MSGHRARPTRSCRSAPAGRGVSGACTRHAELNCTAPASCVGFVVPGKDVSHDVDIENLGLNWWGPCSAADSLMGKRML